MKGKLKVALMFTISVFSMVIGFNEVKAATLVQGPIDNVYYTRRGGGQEYMSAQYHIYTMDGKTVYCIEPGVNINTSDYSGAIGWINSPYSAETNRKIQLYGYYGYDYPGHKTLRYRMAAQSLIWEEVGGQIVEFWTEQYGYGDFINLSYERNQILALANAHYSKPSFNGETKTAIISQPITFTDNSNSLSGFEVYSSNNAVSSINQNVLTITPNEVGEVTVTLRKTPYRTDPTVIFVGTDVNTQKMGLFGLDDPVYSAVKLNVLGEKISVEKVDSLTNLPIPRGDGELKNAVYGVYTEEDFRVGQITIGEDSKATSDYLPKLGKFYLKEEQTSLGYILDTTKYYFEITKDNLNPTIKVYEQAIERDVEIFKVKANGETAILKAEPNVTFEFYLKSNMELYETATTNEKGHLSVRLPYGTYIVKQTTSTPNYEKVEDFEIVIDSNIEDPITKVISNAEITAKMKLVKVDSESKKTIVRDGIKFKIKNLDTDEYVCQKVTYPSPTTICVFETKDGGFITPYVLSSGNYQIEELENQTIEGYLWNSMPLQFSITDNSNFLYDENYGVMIEVQFENKQVKGEFELTKIGEQIIFENDTFRYEEIKLDGVKYKLYANGNIISQDGTLIYKDKELIKSFITKDGYYKLSDLYLGGYCLVEDETVLGHVLDDKPHCFELKYKDQYTETISLSFELKNYLPKGTLVFTKTDLVTGEPIKNTLIDIYFDNEDTNESVLIFSGYTDENGNIRIENLPIGKGHIIERESADGYQITEEIVYFEILENGEIVKAKMTNDKIIIEVPNTSSKSYTYLIPISLLGFGIIMVLIAKLKKKDK